MTDFGEYQLKEFERIAEAHFKTADAIASFFRYYLIVMSLPATAAAFLLSTRRDTEAAMFKPGLSWLGEFVLGLVLLIVACVGLCLMLYLSNLRMDGILYARTVNAIRKYFYDSSDLPVGSQQRMRVLPQTRHVPPYFELQYFGPVIWTFLFLDTSYFLSWVRASGSWCD